ncbi:MAG: tRNA epoxyqueuosine(34) reductase QueG [Bacteroidales bacterium]|nr:tRNA epoxyqueuosine(34) reductase QueG [Bacteroidales bacterium]
MDRSTKEISAAIRAEALRLGFADCGFCRVEPLKDDGVRLKKWLDQGYHARMDYMARNFEKRLDPAMLFEGAKSVISVLLNYYTDKRQEDSAAPVISKYAYGKDYHTVMKDKLRQLFGFINKNYGRVSGRIFVDSAPVLEKSWARKAGLGWVGKNSLLISPELGSFVFIGEIICDLDLDCFRSPGGDLCGDCTRCIEACPTNAILGNRTLDARKCISYQTTSNKGEIDEDLRPRLSNRLFGCDICQEVCPWNKRAVLHSEPAFGPSGELMKMKRKEWFDLDRDHYSRLFKDSPVKEAGYDKLMQTLHALRGPGD